VIRGRSPQDIEARLEKALEAGMDVLWKLGNVSEF
jgi:hypothetical protein